MDHNFKGDCFLKKLVILFSVLLFLNSNYGAFAEVSQQDIQRYSAYYSNGMQYFKNQQYSSAITEFKKVLRFSPYDKTTQTALVNAYLAKAEYLHKQNKEIKKALVNYKSAYFYSVYWQENADESTISNSCLKAIHDLEKRLTDEPTTPDGRMYRAKSYRAQGELAAAGYELQQIKNSKFKEFAYENLANIYKNLNNLSLAMDYIKNAIDINPKNPKLHFDYGIMLDEVKNYEASMEQYNLALQYGGNAPELLEVLETKWLQSLVKNPEDSQSYVNLGAIYQKQGNYEQARTQYLKALNLNKDDDVILQNLASLYLEQKNYNAALGVYNDLLAKNPKDIEIINYKADILKKLGRYDEAITQYETILAIKPENQDAKAAIDDIIMNNFSPEKLLNHMAQAALKKPNNYEAQFNYALELHKNKNYTKAIEYYTKAKNLNPSKEETYLNLAQIYIEQKNYTKANEIVNKGLMIMPNNQKLNEYLADIRSYSANNQYDLATKLFEQKKYKQAIAEYSKIQNQNDDVKAAIASCYWELKDYANANKYYGQILNNQPNNIEFLLSSAWAYYSLNDYSNASELANRIISLDKNNADAKNILKNVEEMRTSAMLQDAIALYEKADYKTALSALNTYLSKQPNDEYGLYYKGLTLDELKKNNDAVKIYKSIISKNPNFAEAYYSLAVDLDNMENYKDAVANYEKFVSLKNGQNDDMTKFSIARIKELKEYLASLKK